MKRLEDATVRLNDKICIPEDVLCWLLFTRELMDRLLSMLRHKYRRQKERKHRPFYVILRPPGWNVTLGTLPLIERVDGMCEPKLISDFMLLEVLIYRYSDTPMSLHVVLI